jgi:predicted kinase
LADDIFLTDDGPRVLDCLEFDDELRWGDVLADVAFLAMDLEYRGRSDLARRFLDEYREFAAATWPASLEHHYVAYRALVRSKVACLRARQGDPRAADEARSLLAQCLRHLERGRVRLVLVGGEPGTGKSTLARRLGEAIDLAVLRSDEVRKELAGVGHQTSLRGDQSRWYGAAHSASVYGELLERARLALRRGTSVLIDASWADPDRRRQAAALANQTAADLVQLRCSAPATVADVRILGRMRDASDADTDVAARIRWEFAPWPEATVIDTGGALDDSVVAARRALEAAP